MSCESVKKYMIDVLEQHDEDKEIFYYLKVGHDGYDEDGPKSNLYDLYVWDRNDKCVYNYHLEIWFSLNDDKEFGLYKTMKEKDVFDGKSPFFIYSKDFKKYKG